jgi:ketosteroid isomerase-like protein
MTNTTETSPLLEAVKTARLQWKTAFDSRNAAACAALYEANAVMEARPIATFTGRADIQAFLEKLISEGFTNAEHIDPQIEPIDTTTAILTGGWKMNKASGIVHKELWVLQLDGTAKLREDIFEITGP